MDNQDEFLISVAIQGNYQPPLFDLSGTVPFELYLKIRRSASYETDPRDLVLLTTGSAFDLQAALSKGLVELIDQTSKEVVPYDGNTLQVQISQGAPEKTTSESFITLPTDVHSKDRLIRTMPLHAALHLRALVQPGHQYRLQLRGKDLGIQWWAWGSPPEPHRDSAKLPPAESKRLVSSSQWSSMTFAVVSETPITPKLSIRLSLAEEVYAMGEENGLDSELPSPTIHITVTNISDRPITLKTSGHQAHLLAPGEIPNPRARVTASCPDVQNFSMIDPETQEDLISDAPTFISPLGGGSGRGLSRKQFLTLAAREQIIRTAKLGCRGLITGKEYRVSLRRTECWWANGTLDDLFGEGNAVIKKWPEGPKIPMLLISDDVVVFRYQGRG